MPDYLISWGPLTAGIAGLVTMFVSISLGILYGFSLIILFCIALDGAIGIFFTYIGFDGFTDYEKLRKQEEQRKKEEN